MIFIKISLIISAIDMFLIILIASSMSKKLVVKYGKIEQNFADKIFSCIKSIFITLIPFYNIVMFFFLLFMTDIVKEKTEEKYKMSAERQKRERILSVYDRRKQD